jgi:hypothetical protein
MRKNYFKRLYNFDKTSNSFAIDVSLDSYNDVYDDWDASPFKRRDIEVEFNDYIVDSSKDIPLKYKISIVLHLPQSKKDENKEVSLKSAYQNYYGYALERLNKSFSDLYFEMALYFFLSLLFLTVGSFFFKDEQHILLRVLHEGIFIGGWVFLWEFFTDIFIKRRKLVEQYNLYKRLYTSEIRFMYFEK